MAIEIREHTPGKDIDDFVRAGFEVFRGDPVWIPPLDMEIRDRLTPKKNPFFEHADVTLFTAWRDGKLVGRTSASIDREHLRIHEDEAGFFGYFDTVDDPAVARALLGAAEAWIRRHGMKRMRGPLSLSINEEVGTLIEGFDEPNCLMMAHARPWQAALAEGAGLTKVKDLLAWKYDVPAKVLRRPDQAWDAIQALPEVRMRSVDKSRMLEELKIILEIFNDAWSENWGFVPATAGEMEKAASDLKLIIDENLAFFVEVDRRPVAICICLPNLNEAIADLDGKLFPLGFAKLLWRAKVSGIKSARLVMLGIRKELRGVKRYGALSLAICAELSKRGYRNGYRWAELSWTLEDNHPINLGIKAMGARVYKKYRIFEKPLNGA